MEPRLRTFSLYWRYGGPFCVRSLFQCSPLLVGALLPFSAPFAAAAPRRRASAAVLGATCGGLMAGLLMRANLPTAHAIGVPFLNERYLNSRPSLR